MADCQEERGVNLRLEVILRDGTVVSYNLVPHWESSPPQPAEGGHAASTSSDAASPSASGGTAPVVPSVRGLAENLVPRWESSTPQPAAGGHVASATSPSASGGTGPIGPSVRDPVDKLAKAFLPASGDTVSNLYPVPRRESLSAQPTPSALSSANGIGTAYLPMLEHLKLPGVTTAYLPMLDYFDLPVVTSANAYLPMLEYCDLSPAPEFDVVKLMMHRCGEYIRSIALVESNCKEGSRELRSSGDCYYINMEIHPDDDLAVVRLYQITGSSIMWKSTSMYSLKPCQEPHTRPEKLFRKNRIHFHAKECAEIPFPPMKINFMKDFKCEKTLGKGTEGTVYQCISTFNRHNCVVKEIKPENLLMTYLHCEPSDVNILTMLSHKNIIELYLAWSQTRIIGNHGHLIGSIFVSMKPCARSLLKYLNQRSEFNLETNNYIFGQIMAGLSYLHARNVIHRDIKPGNILIEDDFRVKIADFGIAKIKRPRKAFEVRANHYGSLPYCALEFMDAYSDHDEKVDIFSAGMVYYELFLPCMDMKQRKEKLQMLHKKLRESVQDNLSVQVFDLRAVLSATNALDNWIGNLSLLEIMIRPKPGERLPASEIMEFLDKRTSPHP